MHNIQINSFQNRKLINYNVYLDDELQFDVPLIFVNRDIIRQIFKAKKIIVEGKKLTIEESKTPPC